MPTDLARDWLSCAPPGSRGPFLPAPSLLAASSPKPRSTRCIIDSVSRAPHPPCYFCLDPGSYKPLSSPPPPHPQQPNPETRTHRPAGRAEKRRSPPQPTTAPAQPPQLDCVCLVQMQHLRPSSQKSHTRTACWQDLLAHRVPTSKPKALPQSTCSPSRSKNTDFGGRMAGLRSCSDLNLSESQFSVKQGY